MLRRTSRVTRLPGRAAIAMLGAAIAVVVGLAPVTAISDAANLRWSRVEVPLFRDTWISDVAPTADGFLAIGFGNGIYAFSGDPTARRWQRFEMPPLGPISPFDIAIGKDSVVVVGGIFEGVAGFGGSWWSRDGRRWETLALGEHEVLDSVVAMDDGFRVTGGREVGSTFVWKAWTSSDGRAWAETADLAPGPLVDTPLGLFTLSSDVGVATIGQWVGGEWAIADLPVGDAIDLELTFAGRSLLLVGVGGPEDRAQLRVWRSDDGRSWRPVPVTVPLDSFDVELYPLGDGLVAEDWIGGRLWMTRDGASWGSGPSPFGADHAAHFVEGHGRIVATTVDPSDVIWVAPADGAPDTSTRPTHTPVVPPTIWPAVVMAAFTAGGVMALRRLARPRKDRPYGRSSATSSPPGP